MSELLINVGVMLFGVFISSVSQVMLKKSAQKKHDTPIKEYLNPLVICAYLIFILATLLSVLAYRVVPLSMGPLLETTGYLYITLFGVTIFHERMTKKKWLALTIILIGIVVYTL